jgi:hypothetical protein
VCSTCDAAFTALQVKFQHQKTANILKPDSVSLSLKATPPRRLGGGCFYDTEVGIKLNRKMCSREAFHFMAASRSHRRRIARFSNTAAAAAAAKLQHCAHYLFSASLKLAPNSRVIMSSASFWSNACQNAKDKLMPTLLDALHGSCGATVRRARAAACALLAAV